MASADIDENVDSNHYQHNKEYSLETESESNIDDQKDEVIMIVGIYRLKYMFDECIPLQSCVHTVHTSLQSQKAVSDYLKSKQIPPFGVAEQHIGISIIKQ